MDRRTGAIASCILRGGVWPRTVLRTLSARDGQDAAKNRFLGSSASPLDQRYLKLGNRASN